MFGSVTQGLAQSFAFSLPLKNWLEMGAWGKHQFWGQCVQRAAEPGGAWESGATTQEARRKQTRSTLAPGLLLLFVLDPTGLTWPQLVGDHQYKLLQGGLP